MKTIHYNIDDYFQKKGINLNVDEVIDGIDHIATPSCISIKRLRQQAKALKKYLVQFHPEVNLATCQNIIAINYRYKDWKHALSALPK